MSRGGVCHPAAGGGLMSGGDVNGALRTRGPVVACLALGVAAVDMLQAWEDGLVLAAVIAVVAGLRRKMWAALSVILVAAAFPPWGWPTWWCCYSPLIALWRGANGRSVSRDLVEALVIGFAMCWLTTGFVRDAVATRGVLLQGTGCLLFGLQMLLFPLALRPLGGRSMLMTAVVMTAVATLGEWLQASFVNGVAWSMMALALPVAATPLAQWAAVISPFGVSALLYAINFLWLPERASIGWRRWRGAIAAASLFAGAWLGGAQLAASVMVKPLPFSVMLVQPQLRGGEGPWRPWITLDRLTRQSLEQIGPADLVVWPETSLVDSRHPALTDAPPDSTPREDDQPLTLQEFQRSYQPAYRAACLVGVPLFSRVMVERYGLEIPEHRRVNAACLVEESEIACHEKLSLLPIREGLPDWLNTPWVRRNLLPWYQQDATLKAGESFRVLPYSTRDGRRLRIAASICYESHLPWLPQFRSSNRADAIVHITYDGDFSGHPGWAERQLLACRYRAIETRTWNLVCATWSGSAIIDPRGRIVARLPAKAGVLRSDDGER